MSVPDVRFHIDEHIDDDIIIILVNDSPFSFESKE